MDDSQPVSKELLQAYVDGELEAPAAAQVEALLVRDAAAARYVAQQQALKARLQSAFEPVLAEELPPRLRIAAGSLAAGLGADTPAAAPSGGASSSGGGLRRLLSALLGGAGGFPARGLGWAGAGMVASLLLGLLLGQSLPGGREPWLAATGDGLLAGGHLEQALSERLAATQAADDPIRLGPSFVAKDGPYCRSFVLAEQASAGLACRIGRGWEVQMLARSELPAGGTSYRQAGSALPAPVLEAIEARIAGDSLDAAAEQQAMRQGWRRAQPRASR